MKILKKDFDKAVRRNWGVTSCLLAQALMREKGVRRVDSRTVREFAMRHHKARKAMDAFDKAYFESVSPPDKEGLKELRASLPITI